MRSLMQKTTAELTARDNNPNKVHEKVISPEVEWFRAGVVHVVYVMIKHASRVIQNIAIELTH